MNLFGLEGSGFIISLGITLLLSGLIMYYCVQRINSLETSLIKQSEIMQSFIFKLNTLESIQHTKINDVCNDIAENNSLNEKIAVSDDEEELDDDKDDVEDDSDDDSVDDEDNQDNEDDEDRNSEQETLAIKDITSDNTSKSETKNITLVSMSGGYSLNSDIETDSEDQEISDNEFEDNISLQKEDFKEKEISKTLEDISSVKKLIEVDDNSDTINYNKLKVNELRELAIKKNLVKINDTTKYKKDELIQLLQK